MLECWAIQAILLSIPISTSEGCTRLWKSEIQFDGIFEGLGVQPLLHLRMHEIAANHKFRFDAEQIPLNVMDAHFRSFEHQVLPLLLKDEIGVRGMKALGDPFILRSNTVTPIESNDTDIGIL